eukprot:UN07718
MGNIFDPKRLTNHSQQRHDKDNLLVTVHVPESRPECAMLINGYLRRTMDESIIPMDVIDIIGIFHSYLNLIERKAAKICQKTLTSQYLLPRPKTYSICKTVKYLMDEYNKLAYIKNGNPDPHTMIVNFLYYQRTSLDKQAIGAYFASNNDMIMFKEYVRLFDFKHKSIDIAMRHFLSRCSLPGKAQIIDRIIELFADKYYDDYVHCDEHNYHSDLCVDDVYIWAYSII